MYLQRYGSSFLVLLHSSQVRRVLLAFFLILFIVIFRYNLLTLFYIAQTYATWYRFSSGLITSKDNFDITMASYPLNQTSAGPEYTDVVPAILHHILIGNIDINDRPTWLTARKACLDLHPGYEYKFWNNTSAEKLIQDEYPWFLSIWKSYRYPIQRADSLRYLILHYYGGIFLDLDLHCRRSLGPLRRFDFISPAAYPVGISNGFLMTSIRHPFLQVLVEQLPLFNRNFLLPYATVMFSTGCMYISAQYSLYSDRCRLRLLDYQHHRLSGRISTPLFHHLGSSSWHSNDALFIQAIDKFLKQLFQFQVLVTMLILICLCSGIVFYRKRRRRHQQSEKDENILLS